VQLDLLIRAPRAITADGERACSIGVREGRVVSIDALDAASAAAQVLTLDADEVLLPGLVDTHVHINEPGRTDWEGFATATRAAAAGGVTTVLDMPLNSIPHTCDVDALAVKRASAQGQCYVDVGFWGGAVPGNLTQLRDLYTAGVFGFKCFLLHSGVPEFGYLDVDELGQALRELAQFDGLMIVHAEDSHTIDSAPLPAGRSYAGFLASRPRAAENIAIAQLIELARSSGSAVHVVHLSSSDALPLVRAAQRDGVRLSAETCPHYLSFAAEEIADGATQFKCCPPIREAGNRELLWDGLRDATITTVVSDHSPSVIELKRLDTGDFGAAWGGIASLQLGLAAVWTQARERQFELTDVVRWMAQRPAELAGLSRKGQLAVGFDADFCVLAPDAEFVVDVRALHHKNPVSPYDGRKLTGVVRSTWLRGAMISDHNEVLAQPSGKLLTRGQA
jgi:allantoinase